MASGSSSLHKRKTLSIDEEPATKRPSPSPAPPRWKEALQDDLENKIRGNKFVDNFITRKSLDTMVDFATFLRHIVNAAKDANHFNDTYRDDDVALTLVQEDGNLRELLSKAHLENSFREIINYDKLLKVKAAAAAEASNVVGPGSISAIKNAWSLGYCGDLADTLEATLHSYMRLDGKYYARYTTFAQSSGMGKSRMIDELAKKVLVIPICLADGASSAYPPSDDSAFTWFQGRKGAPQDFHYQKAQAYLTALFIETKTRLEQIAKEDNQIFAQIQDGDERFRVLAGRFRLKMTEGMEWKRHNAYRSTFHDDVAELAMKFKNGRSTFTDTKSKNSPSKTYKFGEDGPTVENAADDLVRYITTISAKRDLQVVVAFDEAHSLTVTGVGELWSPFSELRRALRLIRTQPIFSIFLSTAGKFRNFSPDPSQDPSARLSNSAFLHFEPLVLTPFDVFAREKKFSPQAADAWTLDYVASTEHISRLGRPLFHAMYTRYTSNPDSEILDFATEKLLCRTPLPKTLLDEQSLACLAVRLGLEFDSTTWLNQEIEVSQVEKHMRVCLYAAPGFHRMITICPSEPLLAEAAFQAMGERTLTSELAKHMKEPYLDRGTRGEIGAAHIILLARDCAVRTLANQPTSKDIAKCRVVPVSTFMDQLVGSEHWRHVLPFHYRGSSNGTHYKDVKMETAFEDCWMWFNHFVKVSSFDVVTVEHLLFALSRGAAIICAERHEGIDMIVPYLRGANLRIDCIGAFAFQIKNWASFTEGNTKTVFDKMDPFQCGIFQANLQSAQPLVRFILSFGGDKSGVTHRQQGERTHRDDKFTSYDFWLAGAKHSTFPCIPKEDEIYFDTIMWPEQLTEVLRIYAASKNKGLFDNICRMHPLCGTAKSHFDNWVDAESL